MELQSLLAAASSGLLVLLLLWVWWMQAWRLNLPPGPRPLPIIGNLHQLGKIPHQAFYHLAKQFGPIVYLRLGAVPLVVASSADAARQFLQVHDHNFSKRPQSSAARILGYGLVGISLSPDNRSDLKKLLSVHLLSARRLEESRPVREEEEALLVKSVMEDYEQDGVVNLLDRVCKCTTNVVTRLVMNRRLSLDDIAKFPAMAECVSGFIAAFLIEDFIPCLSLFDLTGKKKQMKALHKQIDEFFEHVIATYREDKETHHAPSSSKDILDVLLSLSSLNSPTSETPLNDQVIKAIIQDIFIAGHRTSLLTIHWAMAELVRNPMMQAKAQQELDDVVGKDRMVAESDLPNLPFLHAVVKETFRLHPPTPLLLPHESTETCKVSGYDIPKKARLLINVWAIGRDSSIWQDPLQFNPQRFVMKSQMDVRGQNFELIPFGSGRRACPGMTLGLINVHYTLATLLHAFEWTLPIGQLPQDLDMSEASGLGLNKATPLLAIPTARLPKHLYDN